MGVGEADLGMGGPVATLASNLHGGNDLDVRSSVDNCLDELSVQNGASDMVRENSAGTNEVDKQLIEDSNLDTLAAGKGMGYRPLARKVPLVTNDPVVVVFNSEQEPTPLMYGARGMEVNDRNKYKKLQEHSPEKQVAMFASSSNSYDEGVGDRVTAEIIAVNNEAPAAKAVAAMINAATTVMSKSDGIDNDSILNLPSVLDSFSPPMPMSVHTPVPSITPNGIASVGKTNKQRQIRPKPGDKSNIVIESTSSQISSSSLESVAVTPSTRTPSTIRPVNLSQGQQPTQQEFNSNWDNHKHMPEKEIIQKLLETHSKVNPSPRERGDTSTSKDASDHLTSNFSISGVGNSGLNSDNHTKGRSVVDKSGRSSSKPKQVKDNDDVILLFSQMWFFVILLVLESNVNYLSGW